MKKNLSKGITLSEILIATVIMVLVSVPVIGLFIQSKNTISHTDVRRDKRYFLSEILSRAQKHSLHALWRYYGPKFASGMGNECGYLWDRLAMTDGNGTLIARPAKPSNRNDKDPNPLGFTQDFMDELRFSKYEARILFEFYPRKDLKQTPETFSDNTTVGQEILGPYGVFHLQAGYLKLGIRSTDVGEDQTPTYWVIPLMCPAIVGRPGLKMEGCPALSESFYDETELDATGRPKKINFHKDYGLLLSQREGDPTNKMPFEY